MRITVLDPIIAGIALLVYASGGLSAAQPPDVALRIAPQFLEIVVAELRPEFLELAEPSGGRVRVESTRLDLDVSPPTMTITGDLLTAADAEPLPLVATFTIEVSGEVDAIVLTPRLIDLNARLEDIPWSRPLLLAKALLLSNVVLGPRSIPPLELPVQSRFELKGVDRSVRSEIQFGEALVHAVAEIRTQGHTVDLSLDDAVLDEKGLLVTMTREATGTDDTAGGLGLSDSASRDGSLFLSGRLLSDVANRMAGRVVVPFHLENPRGRIAGHSSSTILGRKEWYIEFQGARPLAGTVRIATDFTWNDGIVSASRVSLSADGRIHGHGDPGPGGGCGVRPTVHIEAAAELDGIGDLRSEGAQGLLLSWTTRPSSVRWRYDVERVNFCGFTTQGPFRGQVATPVPADTLSTEVSLPSLKGKLVTGRSVGVRVVRTIKRSDGYRVDFDLEVLRDD